MTSQGPMYVWAASVAFAIVVAGWTAMNRPDVRPALPLEHVAGATLIGLFGWETLVDLPGSAMAYLTLTAGLGDARGVEGHQAFVVAQAIFVAAAAFAVAGILRRRTWGSVLGIGLAVAIVVRLGLALFETATLYGDMGTDAYFSLFIPLIGAQALPALAAVALLVRPFVRRSGQSVPANE